MIDLSPCPVCASAHVTLLFRQGFYIPHCRACAHNGKGTKLPAEAVALWRQEREAAVMAASKKVNR